MGVMYRAIADRQVARARLYHRVRLEHTRFERRCGRKRLQSRAGLEEVRDRTIASAPGIELAAVVRVVRRQVRHRKHFARLGVENDDAARFRPIFRNRVSQLAEREILNTRVDRKRDSRAVLGLTNTVDIFDDVPTAILDHTTSARFARELRFESELERFLSLVVDVGEADQVRGDVARRIVAAIFALQENARDSELDNSLGLLRRELALE